ncbi:DUF4254 domain-containing protein [Frigoriflavimonas asaccharolytica]|uniref:Ribosome-associated translation inhibitor RaiA n=1 Tax=Frigoriflavimonas asaccharolytica TaxID=2735899 RepID=A0A8J8K9H6_9FLAO|nr:DUF4254 domain-containing protein [Frigoriflavimonas asaccharolytica]NRS93646.1 ribosome-associated translation inhibitor RaiA [Frigoriflavimonas asaccharolytica]
MSFSNKAWDVFNEAVNHYHIGDDVDAIYHNPYKEDSLEHLLYSKNWIDTVQWHLEDIIRDEKINPADALVLKRRIDASNQKRTDLVEHIDQYFFDKYADISPKENATLNTETIAWAIDRLSILTLKIFHMKIEAERKSATVEHQIKCNQKLQVLLEQQKDLTNSIDQLLVNIENGAVKMKVYKQMKMYNDASLNPILYKKD